MGDDSETSISMYIAVERERSMRVLVLNNIFPPHVLGGYEIACRAVSMGLRERGHEVRVVTGFSPIASFDDPPWVYRDFALRAYGPWEPSAGEALQANTYEAAGSQAANTAQLLKHIRDFQPDVVYAWHLYGIGGLALLDLIDVLGIPWVFHLMDMVPTYLISGIDPLSGSLFFRPGKSLFARGRVIAMSRHVVDEVARTCGVTFDEEPTLVPGWVYPDVMKQRERYMENGQLRLIAAGSINVHKGTHLIVEACAQLVKQGYSNFKVDIYGFGAIESFVLQAAQQGVSEYVHFHGSRTQEEVFDLLPMYDAFLFPTHEREPFGFAPIEAAACGLVSILTRHAGCAERVVDGVHVLKIDRTAESLKYAIERLLTGEADVEAIGRRASRMVRSDLSFSACVDAICLKLEDAAAQSWDRTALDDQRLPSLLYTKHWLGSYLTAHP